ncbi:MAG: DMT family transporter [Anaerolineales bacterium]|nr:DMT family transporter [Anaerolineales bacterium]MCB9127151.1 DMT family transporter [Ardenticatenales bacterium]MCB9171911.1 DMT family transporter [Ardenticatenales bacterium]
MSTESPPTVSPVLVLLIGVLAISTGAIIVRLADAPPLVVAAYRCSLAALALLPLAWHRSRDELRRLSPRDWLLACVSGFFLSLHFATWISSLDYTTVASSVLLVNTNPIWVGLLTPFLSDDRISRLTALGILLSVVGGIVIGAGDFRVGGQALLGDGLALLGAITVTLYIFIGRRLRRHVSLLSYVVLCYGAAALFLLAFAIGSGQALTGYSPQTYFWMAMLALIPQLIGHSSYNWALGWFSASFIAVTLLGEPIGSTILAYFILNEAVTRPTLIGGALILAGIYLAARGELRPSAARKAVS